MPPRCRRHDPRRAITLGHNPALLRQGPPAPRSCRDHLQPRDGRHRRMLSHTPMTRTVSPLSQGGPPRTNTSRVPKAPALFVPAVVNPPPGPSPPPAPQPRRPRRHGPVIGIEVEIDGIVVRIGSGASPQAIAAVIRALKVGP